MLNTSTDFKFYWDKRSVQFSNEDEIFLIIGTNFFQCLAINIFLFISNLDFGFRPEAAKDFQDFSIKVAN